MKKLFLGVMMVALIITSCNKYANDFQALKDQIAALATQVTGVTTLENTIATQTAQIAALQLAIAGLPNSASIASLAAGLSTVEGQILDIQTKLTSLATNGATSAQITALQSQITDLANARIAADATLASTLAQLKIDITTATGAQITALQTQIETALVNSVTTTNDSVKAHIAALQLAINSAITNHDTNITTLLGALQSTVDAANATTATTLQTILTNLSSTSTATQLQAAVDALTAQLATANQALVILLSNAAMFNGDVTLTTNAEVDYYFGKLTQMGIVNGNLTVNTANLDLAHVTEANTILANIGAIIGVNGTTYTITVGTGFFGWVSSITLNVIPGTNHWVYIVDQASDHLTLNHLTSVAGNYTVIGADIDDSMLSVVGGTATLNYPGDYTSTTLTSVGAAVSPAGSLILVNQPTNGTGNINFPSVVVALGGFVGDGTNLNGTDVFNSTNTKSINLGLMNGGQIHNLTANSATWIKLGTVVPNGLTITDTNPLVSTIDLSGATSSTGAITVVEAPVTITSGPGSTLNLTNLMTSTGNITATMWDGTHANAGVVELDSFNSPVTVTINGLQTVANLGSWYGAAGSMLVAPQAITVTLPVYQWLAGTVPTVGNLAAVQNLNLGGAADVVTLTTYPTLLTANINGAVMQAGTPDPTHWASITANVNSGNANLTTLVLSGLINTATLNGLPALTSLTTSGVVNTLVLNAATAITAVNLGHNAFNGAIGFGGPGSTLTVTGNTLLAALAPTALDWMNTLTVTGNPALAHFNFSSYHTDIYSGSVSINIDAPAVMATYTHAVQTVSAGNPGIQATITSPDIMTLKPYIIQMAADIHIIPTTFAINVATNGPSTLTADLNTDNFAFNFAYTNNVQGGGPLHTLGQLGQVQ